MTAGGATFLALRWTTSRAADTEGQTVVTLTDMVTRRQFRVVGGGSSLEGEALAEWTVAQFGARLRELDSRANLIMNVGGLPERNHDGLDGLWIMRYPDGAVSTRGIDGSWGLDSVERIIVALGASVRRTTGNDGCPSGFLVTWGGAA